MKFLAAPVLVLGMLLAPGYAEAQTPDPVVEAIEAIEDGTPFRTKGTGGFTMKLFDISIKTDMKSSTYTDAVGNSEGKATMTMKLDSEKVTITTEYRYFPQDGSFYFKLDKLPKDVSASLEGVKAKTWYVTEAEDPQALAQAIGQAQLTGEHFLEAQTKYPVIKFVEKGSTKKEYRYTYTVNKAQLPNFLVEQARLAGNTLTLSQAQVSAGVLGTTSGTLTVNKKTMLLSKETQQVGSSKDAMTIKSSTIYSFGGTGKVMRPSGAVRDDDATKMFFPTL